MLVGPLFESLLLALHPVVWAERERGQRDLPVHVDEVEGADHEPQALCCRLDKDVDAAEAREDLPQGGRDGDLIVDGAMNEVTNPQPLIEASDDVDARMLAQNPGRVRHPQRVKRAVQRLFRVKPQLHHGRAGAQPAAEDRIKTVSVRDQDRLRDRSTKAELRADLGEVRVRELPRDLRQLPSHPWVAGDHHPRVSRDLLSLPDQAHAGGHVLDDLHALRSNSAIKSVHRLPLRHRTVAQGQIDVNLLFVSPPQGVPHCSSERPQGHKQDRKKCSIIHPHASPPP